MFSKKMQLTALFDIQKFPFVLLRNFKSLSLIDMETKKKFYLLDKVESSNDWMFYLHNEFNA